MFDDSYYQTWFEAAETDLRLSSELMVIPRCHENGGWRSLCVLQRHHLLGKLKLQQYSYMC